MTDFIEELASTFDVLKRVCTGESTLDELGEKIFGPQPKGGCTKGRCSLDEGHEGDCQPVRAVAPAPAADVPADATTSPQAPQAKRAAAEEPPAGEGSP